MALTAASTVYPRGIASFGNWDVLTATAIYKGALIGLVVGTGTVTNYNDAAGHLLIGIADNTCTAAQATAGFKLQVRTITSAVFSATVTGATAATDNGKAGTYEDRATAEKMSRSRYRDLEVASLVVILVAGGAAILWAVRRRKP